MYGARKVWLKLNREGIPVARCTVERLMRAGRPGRRGPREGQADHIADPAAQRARDLVRRDFAPPAPDRLWVADITYVSTWSGWVYVAFVIDAFARRIIGWRCGTSMSTQLVLDALEQAVWTRNANGPRWNPLWHIPIAGRSTRDPVHRTPRRGEHRRLGRLRRRLAYDNALAETINGLYKTELIKPRGPWRTLDAVEYATAEWVDWFNHRRLYEYCGDIPPAELETAYYAQQRSPAGAELSNH